MLKLVMENKCNAIQYNYFGHNTATGHKIVTNSQQGRNWHTEGNNHVEYEVLRPIKEERSVFWG
jgi:hypothetical protein